MDYQQEYIQKNSGLHLEHSEMKTAQITECIPQDFKPQTILDVGCGAGAITRGLAKHYGASEIVGLDVSTAMINKARELSESDKVTNVSWVEADINDYASLRKFDLIVCADIVEHVSDDAAFLRKIKELGSNVVMRVPMEDTLVNRVCKALRIADLWTDTEIRYGHIHHYSERSFNTLLKKSGVKITKVKYYSIPKRTKLGWEIVRRVFSPISYVSKRLSIEISGGFIVYFVTTNKV